MTGLLSHRPDLARRRSPFRPGSGTLPPYLAGRVSEQSVIQDFLEDLAQRAAPPSDIVLYGPRGNGKTALLLWARKQAKSLGIDVVRFSGKVVPTAESLARRISSEPQQLRWLGGAFTAGCRRCDAEGSRATGGRRSGEQGAQTPDAVGSRRGASARHESRRSTAQRGSGHAGRSGSRAVNPSRHARPAPPLGHYGCLLLGS